MKQKIDSFLNPQQYPAFRMTSYLYANILWWIGENRRLGKCDRSEAIEQMNEWLKSAYLYFAARCTHKEVVREMSYLYHFRITLVDPSDFFTEQPYAFEDQIAPYTFEAYLQLLCDKRATAYTSDTFIYNGLCTMKRGCDDTIYRLLGQIAHTNRRGIRHDSLFKKELGDVRHKLISITHPSEHEFDIRIDNNFVFGMSHIKLICILWQQHKINFEQGEEYRQRMHIPITQAYLNMAFNRLKQDHAKDYAATSAQKGYDRMITLMQQCGLNVNQPQNGVLHKSIQMCVAMIGVAPDEQALEEIFTVHGFGSFRDRTEAIGARMNRILNLRYKGVTPTRTICEFRQEIISNQDAVNSVIANIYINALLRTIKGELNDTTTKAQAQQLMHDCWEDSIRDQRKIDMNRLLEIHGNDQSWLIDANVQTFSYFATECPTLISTMEREFEGDFTYDESRKKSCLKDALKNYAHSYKRLYYDELPDIGQELSAIIRILQQEQHQSTFHEVRRKFFHKVTKDSWKKAPLWYDLKRVFDDSQQ